MNCPNNCLILSLSQKSIQLRFVIRSIPNPQAIHCIILEDLKRLLAEEGIETRTPREALKQVYAVDWI